MTKKQHSKKTFIISTLFQILLSIVISACVIQRNNLVIPYPTIAFEDSGTVLQTPSEQKTVEPNSVKTEIVNEDSEFEPNLPPGEYILYVKNLKVLAISQDKKIYTVMEEMPSYGLKFSRDMKKVAFVSTSNNETIFIKDLVSNKLKKINVNKDCEYMTPLLGSWSSDNNFISFICDQVYGLNVTTNEIFQISDIQPPTNIFGATWSPSGTEIFYNFVPDIQYGNFTGNEGMYVTKTKILNEVIERGDTIFMDRWASACNYEWSSDGTEIVYGIYPVILFINPYEIDWRLRHIKIDFISRFEPNQTFPDVCIHWSPSQNKIAFSYGKILSVFSLNDFNFEELDAPIDYIIDWICVPVEGKSDCQNQNNQVDFYFDIGKHYIVTDVGNNLNVRYEPNIKGVVQFQLKTGDEIRFLDGTNYKDDYLWWYIIDGKTGRKGWIIENKNWLENIKE